MVNESQAMDPRFRTKWRASGSVSSGNPHYDGCMAIAARYELAGDDITAMVMRVAAHNDYTDWEPVPKPPLGKVTKLEEECDGPLVQVGFWMGNDRCFPA